MTTAMDERMLGAVRPKARNFYVYMAAACATVAVLGFAPTYWLPIMTGAFKAHPVVHIHGIIFYSWTLFFLAQTWLATRGHIAWHTTMGMVGISFATAMTIFGFLAAINQMETAATLGLEDAGKAFAIVPISSILFFAMVFILAVTNVRRSEWHKRLMLLATISILDAPIARWFQTFLAPPGSSGPPPVAADIPPFLVTFILLVVAIVFDWRTRGRPHPAYLSGGSALVALKVLQVPLSATPLWHSVAGWILALAG